MNINNKMTAYSSIYQYLPVFTSIYQYLPVFTSIYQYIAVFTSKNIHTIQIYTPSELNTTHVSTVYVVVQHGPTESLSTNIPDLQSDVRIPWQNYPLQEEVYTKSLFVLLTKRALSISRRYGRLKRGKTF
jgi:hypothetical protein